MTSIPTITLRQDYQIPRVIRGGWQLSGDHGAVDRQRAIDDIVGFYDAGLTCFDCADIYTGVEEIYGAGLQNLANARGADAADKVKIHTKYVPDRSTLASVSRSDTRAIITRSLQRLGRERLDLVQFHWWDYAVSGMMDVVGYLADLQAEGLIDQIGVTNFDHHHVIQIANQVDLVSAQVQYSVLDQRPARDFSTAAAAHNVHLICYGVLAGGFLTDAWLGRPDPGFDFENRSLVKYRLIIEEFGGWARFQELLQIMRSIANRHDTDIAAVAARLMLENPKTGALIVGARYARHLPRLLNMFTFSLSDEDHRQIADVQRQAPGPSGDVYALERDADGIHGRIMKYDLNAGEHA